MSEYMAAKMDDQITGAVSENERLRAELATYRAALVLIAAIDQRLNPHLGPERWSGIENGCIQCVAAIALGRTDDKATAADFERALVDPQ